MPRSSSSDEQAERPYASLAQTASIWLFGLTVIGSALAIGTVHTTTLLIVAATAFATVALALYGSTTTGSSIRPTLSLPVITCGALALYTLLQALPLPVGLLRVIAPANADVWERALLPFGEPALRWASLSLDPGASVIEAVKWATYAAVFASATAISAKRGAAWGVTLVFTSAMLAAIVTVAHGLAGATRVYGLYQPAFAASAWHIGPLLNPNNLAGYLNLGALAGLGLALTRKPVVPPWIIGVGVMLIVGVEVTSASRAGVFALPLGVLALALVTRRQTGSGTAGRSLSIWIMVGAAAAGGTVLAALGGTRSTWTELYARDLSKIEMLLWTKPLLRDHPFFGIGRGAFESVFPVYRLVPGNLVFTHAENFPAQWASEWGVPVTLAAFVAFGLAFSPRRLGVDRSAVAAGGWMGVAVLLLQNMFDLALEVPAICIAAATVLGSLGSLGGDARRLRAPRRAESSAAPRDRRLPAAIAVAVAGLGLLVLGAQFRTTDITSDRAALRAAYDAEGNLQYPEEIARVRDLVRKTMLRHPAEPYFPLIGALVALRSHDQSAMPWLQHTLERGQVNGRAHLLLAEFLGGRGAKKQALFELRLTVENDGGLAGSAAKILVRWTRDYDELVSAVPAGKAGIRMLDQVAAYLNQPQDWRLQTRCNQEVLARDPSEVGARTRETSARLDALATGKPEGLCADAAACHKEILDHATAIALTQPTTSTAALIRSRLLLVDNKPEEAVSLLEIECQKVTDRIPCLQARVSAAARINDPHPGRAGAVDHLAIAAKELIGNACTTAVSCADMATWVGEIRRGRNEIGHALAMYERAARADPTEARWLKLADVASNAGEHARAAEALERVAQRHGGGDPELKQRIQAERSLAGSRLLQH